MNATPTEARSRVLDSAERLFMQHGYANVSMRQIAEDLGVRQAALYYHAPEGKAQLFTDVLLRYLARHRQGLEAAIAAAPETLRAQLKAAAEWLIGQPPLDLIHMLRTDVALLADDYRHQLDDAIEASLMQPVAALFDAAQHRGEVRPLNRYLLAGGLVAILNWMAFFKSEAPPNFDMDSALEDVVSLLLDGAHAAPPP